MDIDLIVAASGNPPDTPTNMITSTFQTFRGAGSFGASSNTSMSPHSMSHAGLASEEAHMYQYGTSPQSLPSGFGFGSNGPASSLTSLPPTEPTRPYKRSKRTSSGSTN